MTDPVRLTDPRTIRALAHPARLAILEHLDTEESATATGLAEVVGLSPSATSYHLRELARYGMVEEAPATDRRERRWTSNRTIFDVSAGTDAETRAAAELLGRVVLAQSDERLQRFLGSADDEDPDWWDAATFSESRTRLTIEELRDLSRQVSALLRPYARRRGHGPTGSRMVQVTFRAYPDPADTDQPHR